MIHTPTRTQRLVLAASMAALMSGCANMNDTERRTAAGAAIGAVTGAILSHATNNDAGTGAVVGAAAGAVIGSVWSRRLEEQQQVMQQATQGTGVAVTRTPDNQLKLNIPSDISFDKNSAVLKPELRDVLSTFAKGLADKPGLLVRIVGHTDSSGNDAINNPLSQQRADTVRNFLEDRGVPASRIEAVGRGSREPIASNDTPEGQGRNRRVEIFLREPS